MKSLQVKTVLNGFLVVQFFVRVADLSVGKNYRLSVSKKLCDRRFNFADGKGERGSIL